MNKNELEYKDLLQEERQKYNDLKTEHDNLVCEADGLRKENEESESRVQGLEEKINENEAEYRGFILEERLAYSNLKTEHDKLESEAVGLTKELEESKYKIQRLEQKINERELEFEGLINKEKQAYINIKSENDNLEAMANGLRNENECSKHLLESERIAAKKSLEEKDTTINDLQKRNGELQSSLTKSKANTELIGEKLRKVENQLNDSKLCTENSKILTLQIENKRLTDIQHKTELKIKESEQLFLKKQQALTEERDGLLDRVNKMSIDLNQEQNSLKALEAAAENQRLELENTEKNCKELVRKEKEASAMIDYLKNLVTNEKEVIENLGKALNEQSTKYEVQNEQNTILMQEYQNTMNDLDKCLAQNSQLKKDLQKADEIAVDKLELTRTRSALVEKEVELKDVTNKLNDQNICKLCMENKLDTAFLPCGHVVCCQGCANDTMARPGQDGVATCPICRAGLQDKIKVYLN